MLRSSVGSVEAIEVRGIEREGLGFHNGRNNISKMANKNPEMTIRVSKNKNKKLMKT